MTTTRSNARAPERRFDDQAAGQAPDALDRLAGLDHHTLRREQPREGVEDSRIATGNVAEHLRLHAALTGRIETTGVRPDEGGRGLAVILPELGGQKRPPDLLEDASSGQADQPIGQRYGLQWPAVADSRHVHDGQAEPKLVQQVERRKLQVVDRIVEVVEPRPGEKPGTRHLPVDVGIEVELAQQAPEITVRQHDDVVEPVPGELTQPPSRRETAELRSGFEHRHLFTSLGQAVSERQSQQPAADDTPLLHCHRSRWQSNTHDMRVPG